MIPDSVSGRPDAPEPRLRAFPCYEARGAHRDVGRQHGEQAAEQIHEHLDLISRSLKLSRHQMAAGALRFQPLFEQYCPHLLDEILGLAEGARISYADALAVNVRSALKLVPDTGCTAFVVAGRGTSRGRILAGQNSDVVPAVMRLGYGLIVRPADKPAALMWTFGGMIGYHGINSRGVAQFANDLGGGPQSRFALPHYPLKRLMLECETLEEIVTLFRRIPLCFSGNYVVCDGRQQILDIEATPEGIELVTDGGVGFIAHSNHFVCSRFATQVNHTASASDSFTRLERMNQLIQTRFGKLDVDDCQSFLRDRAGEPSAICRSAQTSDPEADWTTAGITVASIVAEPEVGQLHVATGNHPEAPFVTWSLNLM